MPTYLKSTSCAFLRTRDEWGEFSNFRHLDRPIEAGPLSLATSEHLYQAAKYGTRPDIQQQIAEAARPGDAARIGRNRDPGPDAAWNDQRVDVMRWVIRMKREAIPELIDGALDRTGQRPIVEISRRDAFWGAIPAGDVYEGENVLGRLWMELRHHIRENDPLAQSSAWAHRIRVGALVAERSQHAHADRHATGPVYAGIGARATPPNVLADMAELATWLSERGWHLNTGGAAGADSAFASAAPPARRTQFLPWNGFNRLSGPDCHVPTPEQTSRSMAVAAALHPAWNRCSDAARRLHARNVSILLGPDGATPVDAAICWTEDGQTVGGTGMGIRIAKAHGIPVINLATADLQAARSQLHELQQARSNMLDTGATDTAPATEPAIARSPSNEESIPMSDNQAGYPTYVDENGVTRLRVGSGDPERDEAEFQAELRATSAPPIDPALEPRIAGISERFRELLPEPEERDILEERLGKVTGRLFELAPTHPQILDGLDRLAGMHNLMRPNGFVNKPLLEKLERIAADPDVALQQLASSTGATESDDISITAAFAEQAAVFGVTPGPGEPDPRDLWIVSPTELVDENHAASEIAPRPFQNIAEAFALITETITPDGYKMADEREALEWGLVNVPHSQTTRLQKQLDTIAEQIETAKREYPDAVKEKGAETASYELEQLTDRYIAVAGKRDVFELYRDFAANIYYENTKKVWQPRTGSHVSQTTSQATRVDSRDFIRARQALADRKEVPEGTLVAVTGYKDGPDHNTIYRTLDAVRAKYPDIILLHGGARGVQQIAASWAANRGVQHVPFQPDYQAHGKAAIPRRDEQILKMNPRGVIAFVAPDSKPTFLHQEAIRRGLNPLVVTAPVAQRQASRHTIVVPTPDSGTAAVDPAIRADKQAEAYLQPPPDYANADSQDIATAFRAIVDAALPPDEATADQRKGLMSAVVNAFNTELTRAGGLHDQAQRHRDNVQYHADTEGLNEVSDMQLAEAAEASYQVSGTVERLEHVRAAIANTFKEDTGEQWRPPASYSPNLDPTTTAAAADATLAVEAQRERHHLAHDLKGTRIAITGGREGPSRDVVFATMDKILDKYPDAILLHGNAPGIQQIVGEWAVERDRPQITYQPDRRGQNQSTAIVRRDKAILDANPVGVVDFSTPDKPTALSAMAHKRGFRVLPVGQMLQGQDHSESRTEKIAAVDDATRQRPGGGISM